MLTGLLGKVATIENQIKGVPSYLYAFWGTMGMILQLGVCVQYNPVARDDEIRQMPNSDPVKNFKLRHGEQVGGFGCNPESLMFGAEQKHHNLIHSQDRPHFPRDSANCRLERKIGTMMSHEALFCQDIYMTSINSLRRMLPMGQSHRWRTRRCNARLRKCQFRARCKFLE